MAFILRHEVSPENNVTYTRFVLSFKPLKEEQHQVRVEVVETKLNVFLTRDCQLLVCLKKSPPKQHHFRYAKRIRFIDTNITDYFHVALMKRVEYMKVR